MSERDKQNYHKIKADPVKYALYLERKRLERKAQPKDAEFERTRKAMWRAKNRAKAQAIRQAGHAVENAVRAGRLTKLRACQRCGSTVKIQAHHHKGYERAYWLCVVWLCGTCHASAHRGTTSHGTFKSVTVE